LASSLDAVFSVGSVMVAGLRESDLVFRISGQIKKFLVSAICMCVDLIGMGRVLLYILAVYLCSYGYFCYWPVQFRGTKYFALRMSALFSIASF
jgi:hypothetical protein